MIRIFIRDKRWGEVDVVNGKLHVVSDDLTLEGLIKSPCLRHDENGKELTDQEVYDCCSCELMVRCGPGALITRGVQGSKSRTPTGCRVSCGRGGWISGALLVTWPSVKSAVHFRP